MRYICLLLVAYNILAFNHLGLAQTDTSYLTIKSKLCFVSEIDYSTVLMDIDGNQLDNYNNYILVYNKHRNYKIPYHSNSIFWDEYDNRMNRTKKYYTVVIQIIRKTSSTGIKDERLSLYKVLDARKVIYDRSKKNPYSP